MGAPSRPIATGWQAHRAPFAFAKSDLYPTAVMQKIAIGQNAFPDAPPGLTLPLTPNWVDITVKDATGS